MDTPLATKPGLIRTAFRNNVRPRLVHDQQHLSSLIVTPVTSRPFTQADATLRTPARTVPLDKTDSVAAAAATTASSVASAAASSLLSTLDRTGWSFRVEHAVNEIIREHCARQQSTSIYGDLNRMFETTLDLVCIIASGHDPTDEHLLWSEAFLRGVRDPYGHHPPNVRKLLGFIRALQDKRPDRGGTSGPDASQLFVQTYHDNVPANVTLTKIPPPTV